MRIIEVCLSEYLGGLELYYLKCCKWFSSTGHTIYAANLQSTPLAARQNKVSFPILTLKKFRRYLPLYGAYRLSRFIHRNQIDVVHIHHNYDLLLAALTKFICRRKFKLVYTRHMQITSSKGDPYHQWLYRSVDLILTVTKKLKKEAVHLLPVPEDRIRQLYPGASEINRSDLDCSSLRKFQGRFKVGVFSRIQYIKGQHLILQAASILKSKNCPITFFIYGHTMDNRYYKELLQMVKQNKLEDSIYFMGFTATPQNIIGCHDIIVMPSENETFGLVLIEAMRAGVATIGSNAGGVPEIIDHEQNGLLFNFGDHKTLADQIEMLYKDEGYRKRLARSGKEKADRTFDEITHFTTLENLLNQLIGT